MANWIFLRRLTVAAGLVGGLVAGTIFGVSAAVDYAVTVDAERRARDWAQFLIVEMPNLEGLVHTGKIDSEQHRLVREMAKVGDVFRFKLFNERGDLVFISDDMHAEFEPGALTDHNGAAAEVIRTGLPITSVHDGSKHANRPRIYAEAYVPISDLDGNRIGVSEVYLDQTPLAELFRSIFRTMSALLAGAYALAFAGAYGAFLVKQGQAERSLQRADFLALYDPTSGLLNRSGFQEAAGALVASRQRGDAIATLHLDIDHFKSINDTYGHMCGDAFLRHVGKSIQHVLNRDNVAGRIGGDEFAVVAGCTSVEDAEFLANQLQTAISQPATVEGVTFRGNVSIGIHFDAGDLSLDARLHNADLAAYQAKVDGRSCHRVFSEELEERLRRRRYLEDAVASGLAENRFSLVFQPLMRPNSASCAGFEALLRLTDSEGREILPAEFIPIAESTGEIKAIGAWVLERAMRNAVTWPEPLSVSVNLSVRQFEDDTLVLLVCDLLDKTGLPPSRLELEVTESLLITNAEGAGEQLAQLRELGVSVAMDDFGTGYSSLGYLWQFGFDTLKIDRSFIAGIAADPERAREIIGAIVTLGHRLDMKVTAEGVETPMQAALLSELSCDLFQGFHWGHPLPENALGAFLLDGCPPISVGLDSAAIDAHAKSA